MNHCLCCISIIIAAMLASGQDAISPQTGQTPPEQTAQAQAELRRQIHSKQVRGAIPGQISTRLAHEPGDIRLYTTYIPPMRIIVLDSLATLEGLTCQSDLVVLGKVGNGDSFPTTDDGYIYTDWKLTVEETIKDNAASPVQEGQTIIVTQAGGTLKINGHRIYTLSNDREFHTGNQVLLYLRYLPSTGTYSLSKPTGFILSDSTISNLHKAGYIQSETIDKIGLLDLARQAATEKCPALLTSLEMQLFALSKSSPR